MNRGDIFEAQVPGGHHPVLVITRETAIPLLSNVTVAVVTSIVRDLPTEVPLGPEHGLRRECVANCDNLFTLPKSALGKRRGQLDPVTRRQLNDALKIALGLDD